MKYFYKNAVIVLIFLILGYFLVIQFKNPFEIQNFVSIKTITDLQNLISGEEEKIDGLKKLIQAAHERLEEYEKALQEEGTIKDVLMNEVKAMELISGFKDVEGPGIIIKLSDSERALYEGEDPNNIIVHDRDVLIILNDLKIAGAEALSINGQRVLVTSEIKCTGPTITINNYTYGQPFIIKAIGDPKTLEAAIKAPNSFAWELKETWGLVVESQISEQVRIAKFEGDILFNYIVPKEGS